MGSLYSRSRKRQRNRFTSEHETYTVLTVALNSMSICFSSNKICGEMKKVFYRITHNRAREEWQKYLFSLKGFRSEKRLRSRRKVILLTSSGMDKKDLQTLLCCQLPLFPSSFHSNFSQEFSTFLKSIIEYFYLFFIRQPCSCTLQLDRK